MSEKVYTWWSYRAADWTVGDRGRRLDHIWVSRALKDSVSDFRILRDARGWERPSDHVPVTVTLEVYVIPRERIGSGSAVQAGYGSRGSPTTYDTQLRAGHQNVAGELAGAGGEFIAQAARGGGIAFEHALKQAARDPDHGRTFQRDRGGRPPHRHHKRELADQRAGAGDDFGAAAVIDAECAALDDEAGIGLLAGLEQIVAAFEIALFGADRQHAQGRRAQQAQCRDALQQGYIIFDRHAGPVIGVRELRIVERESYHGTSL